jgi:hypothetical protein
MGEARRRKLAGSYPPQAVPMPAAKRNSMIGMLYAGLAVDDDPTLTGATLFLPNGSAPLYVSKAEAKKRPPPGMEH